jgi:hypothetical protein
MMKCKSTLVVVVVVVVVVVHLFSLYLPMVLVRDMNHKEGVQSTIQIGIGSQQ